MASLRTLRDLGVVVDAGDNSDATVPFARNIVDAMNGSEEVLNYHVDDDTLIPLHPKSKLFLATVFKCLDITIFLFRPVRDRTYFVPLCHSISPTLPQQKLPQCQEQMPHPVEG